MAQHLSYDGIEFSVTVKQYQNKRIRFYENKQKFPIYVSKEQFDRTLNLLLITKGDNKQYVLIKDFNRFMHSQTKTHHTEHLCIII